MTRHDYSQPVTLPLSQVEIEAVLAHLRWVDQEWDGPGFDHAIPHPDRADLDRLIALVASYLDAGSVTGALSVTEAEFIDLWSFWLWSLHSGSSLPEGLTAVLYPASDRISGWASVVDPDRRTSEYLDGMSVYDRLRADSGGPMPYPTREPLITGIFFSSRVPGGSDPNEFLRLLVSAAVEDAEAANYLYSVLVADSWIEWDDSTRHRLYELLPASDLATSVRWGQLLETWLVRAAHPQVVEAALNALAIGSHAPALEVLVNLMRSPELHHAALRVLRQHYPSEQVTLDWSRPTTLPLSREEIEIVLSYLTWVAGIRGDARYSRTDDFPTVDDVERLLPQLTSHLVREESTEPLSMTQSEAFDVYFLLVVRRGGFFQPQQTLGERVGAVSVRLAEWAAGAFS
jgi:hypothetical protein